MPAGGWGLLVKVLWQWSLANVLQQSSGGRTGSPLPKEPPGRTPKGLADKGAHRSYSGSTTLLSAGLTVSKGQSQLGEYRDPWEIGTYC